MGSVDGLPLFVSSFGVGRAMLCLHGIESHGVRFIGLAARLDGVRVVAPDLRGHGRSPKTGPWTVEQHVADLLPFLTGSGAAPILLGHSFGALLAWELARAAGARIAALILVDPAIGVAPSLALASVTYEASSVGHSWPSEYAALDELIAGRPAGGKWSAALDVAVAMERDADGSLRPLVSGDAVSAAWREMQHPLRATRYEGPVLLVEAGRENGKYVSAELIANLRAQIGDRLEHVVIDATHAIPSDYPDLLASVVAEYLAKLVAASA